MNHQLVVLRGRSASNIVKLDDGVNSAGRHDDCKIRIRSSLVSRNHCEFVEKNGILIVKDLGSANGTFVNGEAITGQRVLRPGDEITIGPVSFRVERKIAAPPAVPSAPDPEHGSTIGKALAAAEALIDDDDEFDLDLDFEDDDDSPPPAKPLAPPSASQTKSPTQANPPAKQSEPNDSDIFLNVSLDDDDY